MTTVNEKTIQELLHEHSQGIDAISIIPAIDLKDALQHTLENLTTGYIPASFRWTHKKTEYAYAYKNYGSWVRSIIVAAKYYYTDEEFPQGLDFGRIARYTWRNNYKYLQIKLERLLQRVQKSLRKPIKSKILSNYTAIPEKVLFRYSKLGEIGKNSVLINHEMGSYFVIGEALTDLEVDFGVCQPLLPPDFSICEECTECIQACPTGAIIREGIIDINRCFQYLSENLLLIPVEYRELWGNRLYGCTTCIDVCPYSRSLEPGAEKHRVGWVGQGMDLINLLSLTESEWYNTFQENQIAMRDRLAIVKNAITALGSLEYKKSEALLARYLSHEHPVIRAYSAWALGKLRTKTAKMTLQKKYIQEENPSVKSEIEIFL